MVYHVYTMASESGVLYIGVTNHLEFRTIQHKQKLAPGFTSKYNVTKLITSSLLETFVMLLRARSS